MARAPTAPLGGSAHHRTLGTGPGVVGISVRIPLDKLAAALRDVQIKKRDTIVYRAINDCLDRLNTQLKRDLQRWMGTKNQKDIVKALSKRPAYPSRWEGAVVVRGKYIPITAATFGAKWSRSDAGGTHAAWARPQMAKRSFMVRGRLKTRTTDARFPIKTLWGPNPAREVIRHEDEVRAQINRVIAQHLMPRIAHHVRREFERAKARHGL